MARRLRLSRLALVLVAIVLVVALALGGFLFSTGAFGVNTNSEYYNLFGAQGQGGYAFGDRTEVLSREMYVANADPTLAGQDVAWSVNIVLTDSKCIERYSACISVALTEVIVYVTLERPDGNLVNLKTNNYQVTDTFCGRAPFFQQPCPVTWSASDVVILRHPDGTTIIPDGWHVRVTVVASVQWSSQSNFDNCAPCAPQGALAAVDRAALFQGIGDVHFRGGHTDGAGGVFVITGESIDVCWSVGYSTEQATGTGWRVLVFSGAQNRVVLDRRVAETQSQLQGCLTYVSTDSDFASGTTNNFLRVTLDNFLWVKDAQIISAVRAADVPRMPVCYDDGFSPQSPKQGETITYSFHCDPVNTAPENAVASIVVRWGYGNYDNEVTLPGSATQYQFSATQAGIINLALQGFTADGVPSGAKNYEVSVEHQPTNTCFGSDAYCNPNPPASPLGIPLWLYFVFAGIALVVAAVLIPRGLIPVLVRALLFMIAVVFFLLAVIFYG